jgi:hypothetical protein
MANTALVKQRSSQLVSQLVVLLLSHPLYPVITSKPIQIEIAADATRSQSSQRLGQWISSDVVFSNGYAVKGLSSPPRYLAGHSVLQSALVGLGYS